MNAILRIFQGTVAFKGEDYECRNMDRLLQKWDNIRTEIEALFDDGLTFGSHCMSLYIQQDREAWRAMLELFEKTKAQGKTAKTIEKKKYYFRDGFRKIMRKHAHRLFEHEELQEDGEPLRYDEGLWIWWLNYYFAEHDKELGAPEYELYPIDPDSADVIKSAQTLERNCHGNNTPPPIPFPASERKIELEARGKSHLWLEWKKMDFGQACRLMDLCEEHITHWRDGETSDYSGKFRKQLKRLLPNCEIDSMDTKYNLYGDSNNWFYINFAWESKHFTWAQVKKALKFVKENIKPRISKFLPEGVEEPYHVVTLKF